MKKIIAVAGMFALAACGGSDAEGDAGAEEAAAEGSVIPSSAGTYTMTAEDGTVTTWALNADGSFAETVGEDVTNQGSWEDNIRGTCLTAEGAEGEACYNMVAEGEDGTTNVIGPDGSSVTMMKAQ